MPLCPFRSLPLLPILPILPLLPLLPLVSFASSYLSPLCAVAPVLLQICPGCGGRCERARGAHPDFCALHFSMRLSHIHPRTSALSPFTTCTENVAPFSEEEDTGRWLPVQHVQAGGTHTHTGLQPQRGERGTLLASSLPLPHWRTIRDRSWIVAGSQDWHCWRKVALCTTGQANAAEFRCHTTGPPSKWRPLLTFLDLHWHTRFLTQMCCVTAGITLLQYGILLVP